MSIVYSSKNRRKNTFSYLQKTTDSQTRETTSTMHVYTTRYVSFSVKLSPPRALGYSQAQRNPTANTEVLIFPCFFLFPQGSYLAEDAIAIKTLMSS